MARDRVAEIGAIRGRKGLWGARTRAQAEVRRIDAAVEDDKVPADADYLPIRLVTALEVFTRECVAELVDHGEPYTGRARSLVKDLKFDFDLTQALVGKKVSFGELASHSIPLNGIADIDRAFEALTEQPLSDLLAGVHDRWRVEVEQQPAEPIIADLRQMKAALNRLHEVRHVLVHEMPATPPFDYGELKQFARAAVEFTHAMDEVVSAILYGQYPLTQIEMNEHAHDLAQVSEGELAALVLRVDPERSDERFQKAHASWDAYRESEATFMSRMDLERRERGSIAPLIYWTTMDELTKERIKWITSNYGEGGGPLEPAPEGEP